MSDSSIEIPGAFRFTPAGDATFVVAGADGPVPVDFGSINTVQKLNETLVQLCQLGAMTVAAAVKDRLDANEDPTATADSMVGGVQAKLAENMKRAQETIDSVNRQVQESAARAEDNLRQAANG